MRWACAPPRIRRTCWTASVGIGGELYSQAATVDLWQFFLSCHSVYDDNDLRQGKKRQTGASARETLSRAPRFWAFISTLDSVSRAPIIERGWKRSAFAFS